MLYNLKYKKLNQSQKVVLEKDGEIVISKDGFQLKGKGAGDVGETISFSEIKEWRAKEDKIVFSLVSRERYVLGNVGNLFQDFLMDFVKARNQFLLKALFMTDGELVAEYEGDFEILSRYEKSLSKGHARFQLYENNIVILPDVRDAFSISLNFLKVVDVDQEFYEIQLILDQGFVIFLRKLGSNFEEFVEKISGLQQQMYQKTVNNFKDIFLEFDSNTLIKLAYEMRNGKAVQEKKLKKIGEAVLEQTKNLVLHDDLAKKHFEYFSKISDPDSVYFGISPQPPKHQSYNKEDLYSVWYFMGIPEKNLVVAEITNGGYRGTYFFRIIMEKGEPADKIEEKLLEINQALLKLKFVTTPFYKDKRELRRSIYRFALRKLPFLRLLRRSYVGRLTPFNEVDWDKRIQDIFKKAEIIDFGQVENEDI
ncbi:hypothetical protein KKD70_02650 [Patescibacteria group bacterium]|nr:hypothetical protein [Patescibacteria group bacterium]